jgi:ERF superfamily
MNIFQRLNEVKKAVSYIRKDARVETYMGITHDKVTAETRKAFIDAGVVVYPSETANVVVNHSVTKGGKPIIRFEGNYAIIFQNVEDPNDRSIIHVTAHALDHGDKAPGKAMSYATKIGILKMLQLETGEDDESRAAVEEPSGLGVDYLSSAKISIDSAKTSEELKDLWTGIVAKCKEANDMEAYNHLKNAINERNKALKANG